MIIFVCVCCCLNNDRKQRKMRLKNRRRLQQSRALQQTNEQQQFSVIGKILKINLKQNLPKKQYKNTLLKNKYVCLLTLEMLKPKKISKNTFNNQKCNKRTNKTVIEISKFKIKNVDKKTLNKNNTLSGYEIIFVLLIH